MHLSKLDPIASDEPFTEKLMSWEWNKDNSAENLDCGKAFAAMRTCPTPLYQVRHYHREGALDGCGKQVYEFFHCLRLKLKNSEAVHNELKEQYPEKEPGYISPVPHVFEFRNYPPPNWPVPKDE